jgi:diguanylate cyclase
MDAAIVLDRLLWTLLDLGPDAEPEDLADFRVRITEYRKGLAVTPPGPELAAVARACLETCERYLTLSRRYGTDRESRLKADLIEAISILHKTAATIAGDSTEFNDQLHASTENFGRLTEIDDVRELKRLLTAEVSTLRTAVEARRQRDEQTRSNLTARLDTLQSRLVKSEEDRVKAEASASIDPLTHLANRGAFDRALRQAMAASTQARVPLSIVIVDIDNFKEINDTHGHPVGDRVLLCTALWLLKAVRKADVVARYGGDEFVVILSDATIAQVEARLSQALAELGANSFEYEANGEHQTVRYTASIGCTEMGAGDTPADLVKRADEALYEAKRKGKNRVITKKRSMLAGLFSRTSDLRSGGARPRS